MDRQTVCNFLKEEAFLSICETLKQHWEREHYSYSTKSRPYHGLMLLISGDVKFLSEREELTAKSGDVVFLPKNACYEAVFDHVTNDYLVNFNISIPFPEPPHPALLFNNASLSLFQEFEQLIQEAYSDSYESLKCKGLFYLLLDTIIKSTLSPSCCEHDLIEQIKKLLTDEKNLPIFEIARVCGISETGLRKKFKENTGMTPVEFRLQSKIKKAVYLLESSELSVSEVAERLGFYDAAYFCKVFKKQMGYPPTRFIGFQQL